VSHKRVDGDTLACASHGPLLQLMHEKSCALLRETTHLLQIYQQHIYQNCLRISTLYDIFSHASTNLISLQQSAVNQGV
jgi:hypothetical protein